MCKEFNKILTQLLKIENTYNNSFANILNAGYISTTLYSEIFKLPEGISPEFDEKEIIKQLEEYSNSFTIYADLCIEKITRTNAS